jgi:hypothetical protein
MSRPSNQRWDDEKGYYIDSDPEPTLPMLPALKPPKRLRTWQKVAIATSIALVAYVVMQLGVVIAFAANAIQYPPKFRADYFDYGYIDGIPIFMVTLHNLKTGEYAEIIAQMGIISKLHLKDSNGKLHKVVEEEAFPDMVTSKSFIGATLFPWIGA